MADRREFRDARDAILASPGRGLSEPFVSAFPVAGASVSVLAGPAAGLTVSASDSVAGRLDELQFDLGEGPCWSAFRRRGPVVCREIRAEGARWPAFTAAVIAEPTTSGVGAMYAFPLAIGSLGIGAIDFYTNQAEIMEPELVKEASALADLAAWQVLRTILEDRDNGYDASSLGYSRREVHQATGMIVAQLGVSADDAALLLRAHAYSSGRTVRDTARDVVERQLDFGARDNGMEPNNGR